MPDDRRQVSVGGHRLTLTNLDKVLYPGEGITKAEVVRYYLQVAPVMFHHVRGRALALVRYPDGIGGQSFFQKNRPPGTPEWVRSAVPPGEETEYIIATGEADFAWLGNIAALEIHQQHGREPDLDRPDYLIIDIDPPEDASFAETREIALLLHEHLAEHGYHPLVKTTGGNGLHIVCPLEAGSVAETVLDAARDLAHSFRAQHPRRVTLALSKAKRRGRVFLDIYRHRRAQTAISPYSLRGRPGATVAFPITRDILEDLDDPRKFNLRSVPELLAREGDAWEDFDAHRTALHTKGSGTPRAKDEDREVPDALREYAAKRTFDRTPEPTARSSNGQAGRRFVVHRHHASHLHYDLRLEEDGVLKSWAVPKGLPPRPGITRLAIQTEDHPLDYIDFEGDIPEGEYGGGRMWVFDTGTYEQLQSATGKLKFRLRGDGGEADFRLIRKEESEWLLQRIDEPEPDWLRELIEPMAPVLVEEIQGDRELEYEVKWDGIRVLIYIDEGDVRIITRRGNDVTQQFPELLDVDAFRTRSAIIDGEIVVLDQQGHPDFGAVLKRVQRKAGAAVWKLPVTCYVFDCLYLDGRPILSLPLWRRREWLEDTLRGTDPYRFSRSIEDGKALFTAVREKGLEGIIGKDPHSPYRPGRRHESWIKVKVRHEATCVVIGFSPGKGRHAGGLGALHIAEPVDDILEYRGRAGTGLTDRQRDRLLEELTEHRTDTYSLDGPPPTDAPGTVWVEPHLAVEIEYAEVTEGGRFRKPTIRKVRADGLLRTP